MPKELSLVLNTKSTLSRPEKLRWETGWGEWRRLGENGPGALEDLKGADGLGVRDKGRAAAGGLKGPAGWWDWKRGSGAGRRSAGANLGTFDQRKPACEW